MGSERTDDTGELAQPSVAQPTGEAEPSERETAGVAAPFGRLIAGRYRLADLIGVGAMGAVWLARDEVLDVDVAVKEIRPPFAFTRPGTDPGSDEDDSWADSTGAWVSRALREARNAARLRANPHVVTVHDAVVDDGAPWIVMEAVAARSLQEAVDEDGPLPLADVARIGLAVLDALVAAQALGVVHRDVKPSNILLAHDGRVLLTDFGIAAADTDPTLTQPPDGGLPSGTPAYMAPERLRGGPTTLTADLFALGATLLFAADGVAPFHRDDVVASLQAVLFDEPEPSRDLGPLAPVIAGLLLKEPAARLRADGVAALLTRAQRALGAGIAALPPAAADVRPPRGPAGQPVALGFADVEAEATEPADGTSRARAGDAEAAGFAAPDPPVPDAAPVHLGQLDLGTLASPGRVDVPGRRRRSFPLSVSLLLPAPLAALAVVVVLALVGLAAWGAVAAGADLDGAPRSTPSARVATRGASPTATAPGGRGPLGGRAGAVPGEMVGNWFGTVTQNPVTFDVTLRITGGEVGETVGRSVSSEGCGSDLVLREAGVSAITVQEVITQANQRCTGAFRLLLTLNSNGTLGYFYDATVITSFGVATLNRTAQPPTGG
ncbi:serine/threonine-protein kinase [Pseudofrankia inefficax]|uniref:non-specific serine/threonine protein kinase n=1 Tax=Pseudofrankia inefficax (strain DSM 45817 / CECT 9037 / DDB 130130 / EuI1c) TaxID=298654 RepID=E3J1Q0_PSEI1|nr:serine/threonine-protein kinase [Pseudofrankia inefficax]ADP82858.1 serine/threonine protein kinase [Pseudofrankia inefficax]